MPSEPSVTLTLIRHGESDHNAAGLCQGSSDVPVLSPLGRAQAAGAAALLGARVDRLWVSPLRRARDTAAAIRARRPDLPVPETVAALQETSLPAWEGRSFARLRSEDPVGRQFWKAAPEDFAMARDGDPGFRPGADALRRAETVLAMARAMSPGSHVVAVTHGGTIRALLTRALGMPGARLHAAAPDNASATRLALSMDGAQLAGFNEAVVPGWDRLCEAARQGRPLTVLAPTGLGPNIAPALGTGAAIPVSSALANLRAATAPQPPILAEGPAGAVQAVLEAVLGLAPGAGAALGLASGAVHAIRPAGPDGPAALWLLNARPVPAGAHTAHPFLKEVS